MIQVSVIASKLNIYTLQSVAVSKDSVIVPTLDGQLLRVTLDGKSTSIVNLVQAELGVPFGIVEQEQDLIVTVSGYLPQHYLLRVKSDGKVETIADLTQRSGFYGAPFGVTLDQNSYLVTISTDVVESSSELIRVSRDGKISPIANLTKFGNPFGLVVQNQSIVVAQSYGQLVRVEKGEATAIVDLKAQGFGIPFDVTIWRDRLTATTNSGLVVQVDENGKVNTIADLAKAKYQIPSGIATFGKDLVVTTNGGFLLRISA
ncbi:hypothetical protein [Leptolyngbya sp. NIES-2104]|uniref:hypothetical protein n=1 Tax=Leptolyngbya sp. NIES-2104 TaxID=1552121 RepID=UPI00073F1ADC|nr:hypothetical protein [Leptolyngbya sp. NIES-2104]